VVDQGINDDNLFLWMQDAGYQTYYVGKLWNFHAVDNYNKPFAKGFNGSEFLLDPYTYQYWNAQMTRNGQEPVSYSGQYSIDVVAEKSLGFLRDALAQQDPFFLTIAPIAPHSNWVIDPEHDLSYLEEPKSAPRHQHLFEDYIIPRTKSFNAPVVGGASWVKGLSKLNDTVLAYNDHYQRQRLRALQAVDEMLPQLVQELRKAGQLDNTYIFYTTDNGYHISQHQMHPGKECGYGKSTAQSLIADEAGAVLNCSGTDRHRYRYTHPILRSWTRRPPRGSGRCRDHTHRRQLYHFEDRRCLQDARWGGNALAYGR
jgi:N-acetylglucosamine-6-sulfatase